MWQPVRSTRTNFEKRMRDVTVDGPETMPSIDHVPSTIRQQNCVPLPSGSLQQFGDRSAQETSNTHAKK